MEKKLKAIINRFIGCHIYSNSNPNVVTQFGKTIAFIRVNVREGDLLAGKTNLSYLRGKYDRRSSPGSLDDVIPSWWMECKAEYDTDKEYSYERAILLVEKNHKFYPAFIYKDRDWWNKVWVGSSAYDTVKDYTTALKELKGNAKAFCFTPQSQEEYSKFAKIAQWQQDIFAYEDELKHIGIFSEIRKRKILKEIDNMLDYAHCVVGKACIDRQRNFYQQDFATIENTILVVNEKIENLKQELSKYALTQFAKRKEIKEKLQDWGDLKAVLIKLRAGMQARKTLIEEKLAAFDAFMKRVDEELLKSED